MTPETTQATTTGAGVRASVLFVKHYPTEDIVVLLHDSPTVITLRDVTIKTQDTSNVTGIHSKNALGIQDICKGVELIVADYGVWNMYYAVMRGGCVIVCNGKGNNCDSEVAIVSKRPLEVTLPARRKRVSMK